MVSKEKYNNKISKMRISLLTLACALTLTTAHFDLSNPPSRGGSDHENQNTFPCGGHSVSDSRTPVSLDDPRLPIALSMGHDQSALQVLLALGTDPGENFNITLVPTMRQMGMGEFCLPDVVLGEEVLGVAPTEGLNATLQVVTNAHGEGGLYNCADLTFSSDAATSDDGGGDDSCFNDTSVTAEFFTGDSAGLNANESTPRGQPQSGGGEGHGHDHEEGSSTNLVLSWGVLGAAFAGVLMLV